MFTLDSTIDTITTAQKTLVNTVFAKNEKVASALTEFTDAQATYVKSAAKSSTDVVTKLAAEATKFAQEVGKFDHTKAYEQFADMFKAKK